MKIDIKGNSYLLDDDIVNTYNDTEKSILLKIVRNEHKAKEVFIGNTLFGWQVKIVNKIYFINVEGDKIVDIGELLASKLGA